MKAPDYDFPVIRNAPPPPTGNLRGKTGRGPATTYTRYPWKEMNVGDAFDIPLNGISPVLGRWPECNRVNATITNMHKRNPDGPRFMARMMPDYRVRVWRIK